MADGDPMTQAMCAASRAGCKELRTVEHQNLLLTLRAEIRDEVDAFKARIDQRIGEALANIGYTEDGQVADTAVPADHLRHPPRRDEDRTLRQRMNTFIAKNATWLLALLFALVAGDTIQPYAARVLETLTRLFESLAGRP